MLLWDARHMNLGGLFLGSLFSVYKPISAQEGGSLVI